MAGEDTLRKFAYYLMVVNIAAILLNISGFFPIHYTIGGYDAMQGIVDNISDLTAAFSNASQGLDYLFVVGFAIINGIQILLNFILLVFGGLAGIAALFGIPAIMYLPIVVMIDAIIIYDFANKILRLG